MELDKKAFRRENMADKDNLFNAGWRKVLYFNRHSEIDDLQGLYDTIVSGLVNNPRSGFYLRG